MCVHCRSGSRRNKARSRKIERALKRHFEKLSSSGPGPRRDGADTSSDSDSEIDSDDDSSADRTDRDGDDSVDDDNEVSAQHLLY